MCRDCCKCCWTTLQFYESEKLNGRTVAFRSPYFINAKRQRERETLRGKEIEKQREKQKLIWRIERQFCRNVLTINHRPIGQVACKILSKSLNHTSMSSSCFVCFFFFFASPINLMIYTKVTDLYLQSRMFYALLWKEIQVSLLIHYLKLMTAIQNLMCKNVFFFFFCFFMQRDENREKERDTHIKTNIHHHVSLNYMYSCTNYKI